MRSEASDYLKAAVQECMKEAGAKRLAWVPLPTIDDCFDEESCNRTKYADSSFAPHEITVHSPTLPWESYHHCDFLELA